MPTCRTRRSASSCRRPWSCPRRARPGSSTTIHVPADAWATDAVRVTVRARDIDGRAATASLDVSPDRDAPAVAPEQAWALPQELLGGLDVAAASLGAAPVSPRDEALELQLHDGTAHSGIGWYRNRGTWTLPETLTVDLAGDAPVPIAGTIFNPQASLGYGSQVPRRFALLLSIDGSTWEEVLTGELSTRMRDQAFVLPQPRDARFAQLRIDSTHGSPDDELALGEWKVVAVPGATPDEAPLNIAAPALGGHVSWIDPQSGDEKFWYAWLDEDPARQDLMLDRGDRLTWALGFREDRRGAAHGAAVGGPDRQRPGAPVQARRHRGQPRLTCRALDRGGHVELERAGDGSVPPFTFAEPTWARFVRFTGDAPREDTYYWQMPATLRAIEAPTDETYRSVMAEWGELRPGGTVRAAGPAGDRAHTAGGDRRGRHAGDRTAPRAGRAHDRTGRPRHGHRLAGAHGPRGPQHAHDRPGGRAHPGRGAHPVRHRRARGPGRPSRPVRGQRPGSTAPRSSPGCTGCAWSSRSRPS